MVEGRREQQHDAFRFPYQLPVGRLYCSLCADGIAAFRKHGPRLRKRIDPRLGVLVRSERRSSRYSRARAAGNQPGIRS
jgi:hypothetical protein